MADVEDYLKSHDWKFEEYKEGVDKSMNKLVWVFGKTGNYNPEGHYTATGWFTYQYTSNEIEPPIIMYQYITEEYYKKSIATLKSLSYKLEKVLPHADGMDKIYKKGDLIIQIEERKIAHDTRNSLRIS